MTFYIAFWIKLFISKMKNLGNRFIVKIIFRVKSKKIIFEPNFKSDF